jgi:hypothetical protein
VPELVTGSLQDILDLEGIECASFEKEHIEYRVYRDIQINKSGPFGLIKQRETRYDIEYYDYQNCHRGWQLARHVRTETEKDAFLAERAIPQDQGWTARY